MPIASEFAPADVWDLQRSKFSPEFVEFYNPHTMPALKQPHCKMFMLAELGEQVTLEFMVARLAARMEKLFFEGKMVGVFENIKLTTMGLYLCSLLPHRR